MQFIDNDTTDNTTIRLGKRNKNPKGGLNGGQNTVQQIAAQNKGLPLTKNNKGGNNNTNNNNSPFGSSLGSPTNPGGLSLGASQIQQPQNKKKAPQAIASGVDIASILMGNNSAKLLPKQGNRFADKMSEATRLTVIFKLCEKYVETSMKDLTEEEICMILQSGQKWNIRSKGDQVDMLDWVRNGGLNQYKDSKVTQNSKDEMMVIDKWKRELYRLLETDKEFTSLQIKTIPWNAIFDTRYATAIGEDLIAASLITQNKYRAFKHSAFFASTAAVIDWLQVAFLSWEFVFGLMNYAIDSLATFKRMGTGRDYYYEVQNISVVKLSTEGDARDIFGAIKNPTIGSAVSHATCMDWRKIFRNSVFKDPEIDQPTKAMQMSMIYNSIANWRSRFYLVVHQESVDAPCTDDIQDPESDECQGYFEELRDAKKLFRAIVRKIVGQNQQGARGKKVFVDAISNTAVNKKLFK